MRLAILSDVHANPIALDAVIGDVKERGGADGYCVLGDLVSAGYDPPWALRRLTSLPNVRIARGNTDRYTLGHPYPHLTVAQAQADPGSCRSSWPPPASAPGRTATSPGPVSSDGWPDCRWSCG